MLEKYNFNTLESIEKSLVFTKYFTSDVLNNPENVLIVSLDVKNLKSIVEQLNNYKFEKNNIHLIYPGMLEDDTQLFSLLNEILSEGKCKLFILQNKFSDSKYFFEAADIANFYSNTQVFHNSLDYVKQFLDSLNPKVYRSTLNISVSGHQQHLGNQNLSDRAAFDSYRLGNIISQIDIMNKPIQYSDVVIADISVLKQCELPSRTAVSSSGIYTEMFNQLTRTSGMSNKTRVTILSGLDQIGEDDAISIDAIAQSIYYYLSGCTKSNHGTAGEKFTNYILEECLPYENVNFLKDEHSLEWYAEFPFELDERYSKYKLVPCNYNDYQYSGKGELSPRLAEIFRWLEELPN